MGLAWRKAIYIPFPQAVPSTYTLDAERCLNARLDSETGFRVLACVRCSEACKPKAIDYDMRAEIVEREVGAIVVATGYRAARWRAAPRNAATASSRRGRRAGVRATALCLGPHRRRDPAALRRQGPQGGRLHPVRRTRGIPAHGVPYCSRICCMYTAKHVLLAQAQAARRRATVFFMDVRAGGKGYEEFVQRVAEEERVLYVRGQVSEVVRKNGADGPRGGHPLGAAV